MSGPVEFRVLGGLSLRVAGEPVPLGPPKQRQVLALLLAHGGEVVPPGQLIEELWNDRPPASADANLRGYVGSLRRSLPHAQRHRLVRRPTGYALSVGPDEFDLSRFDELLERGRGALAADDLPAAVHDLERAVALWRGRCCEDVTAGPVLGPILHGVDQRRLVAAEDLAEARLRCGDAFLAVKDLRRLMAAHPTRERAAELLMRALYEIGDAGAALEVFTTLRSVLVDTLGIEPGRSAEDLHRAILNRTVVRRGTPEQTAGPHPAPFAAVPRQLPRAVALVGREEEVRRTRAALVPPYDPATPSVVLVHGPSGVGASALARTVGHAVAPWFPDGQLYASLGGAGGRQTTRRALAGFLRALGAGPGDVPFAVDEAAAAFRSAVADRRVLVLIDAAADPDQVEPLLPGTPANGVLITSRTSLSALPDVERVELGPLPSGDATTLLLRWSVEVPSRVDRIRAARMAEQCGRLPGAMRAAAADLGCRGVPTQPSGREALRARHPA